MQPFSAQAQSSTYKVIQKIFVARKGFWAQPFFIVKTKTQQTFEV
jgi:hypothetical protein